MEVPIIVAGSPITAIVDTAPSWLGALSDRLLTRQSYADPPSQLSELFLGVRLSLTYLMTGTGSV